MINIENLGKRLRIIREFFKFTQQQMADVLQMNPSTYKNNERGLHAIQINNLEPLHNELGISVEWLLFEKEPFLWKDIQIIEKKEDNLQRKDLFMEELNEMKEILERVPIIRHSVMGHYQDCKIRYKDLIAETMTNKN